MTLRDTSRAAQRVQAASFGAMTGSDRVLAAVAMAEEARVIALAGIRRRHPDLDDNGVHRAWLRLLHGPRVELLFGGASGACS